MAGDGFAALVQATAGAGGGVFASVVLQPIEVAKTRIQTGQAGDASTMDATLKILREEGVAALYRGLAAKSWEAGSKNFVYFYIYEAMSRATLRHRQIGTALNLLLGYIAGVATTTTTMPLEVLSTRLQASTQSGVTFMGMLRHILQTEGLVGLYKGFLFNVALCVNPAIQNTTFDQMKAAMIRTASGGDPKVRVHLTPLQAFMLGAASKALATVVTYPLVRIKTILQAGEEAEPGKHQQVSLLRKFCELYRGLGSALLKTILQAALLYMMKDQIASFVVLAIKSSSSFLRPRGRRHKLRALAGRPLAS